MASPKTRLILQHRWALGDTVLLTGLVRDIHRAYPGQYEIQVDTHWTPVWQNNPYVTTFADPTTARRVEIDWGDAIRWNSQIPQGAQREKRHILSWYHYDFEKKTGISVPVTDPRPDLHLTAAERVRRIPGRYWVLLAGGKLDLTVKHWHAHRMQEVVDALRQDQIACVQVGASHSSHIHPPLQGVTNLIGQTENVRDLWNIILHADGVICGVTGAMHIAAAFERPCVVHAGGREEPWFEAYRNEDHAFGPGARPVRVEHQFLHTLGQLDCCDVRGCWKKRTIPLDPQDLNRQVHTLCRQPVRPADSHPVARCQDLITADQVVTAVRSYYTAGVLLPIPELKPEPVTLLRPPSVEPKPQQPYQQIHPQELTPRRVGSMKPELKILDHPTIGGKLTVCVLCYGPHTDLAQRCLSSLLLSLPADRIDLRIGANDVAPATMDYLQRLPVTKIYSEGGNRHKYPRMREMFWDESCPITTNYTVWLDDDTWVLDPRWASNLGQTIVAQAPAGFGMFGDVMSHDLTRYTRNGGRPDHWFRAADWYSGRNLRLRSGQAEVPSGSVIDFAVGWCWAIATAAIRAANVPDVRLNHNGGDITIGEQLHQAGIGIQSWNRGKSLIACPTRENGGRRGYSEKFPWDPGL